MTSIVSKEKYLKKKFKEYDIEYPYFTKKEINKLYSLWLKNKIPSTNDLTNKEYLYFALYFDYIANDYDLANKYYLLAIKNNPNVNNIYYKYATFLENVYNDTQNALKYYNLALDNGNYNAAYNIARIYDTDRNLLNDSVELNNKILKYYKLAADNNVIDAQTAIALFYEKILNQPENAVKYYLMAISNNDPTAMYLYAKYLYNNEDYSNVEKLLNKAGKLGNGDAYALLALYYQDVKNRPNLVVKTLEKGTELGSDKAYLALGNYYYEKGNYDLAVKNYKAAIALDNVSAMNNLGQYYLEINNQSEGIKYITNAAKLGNIEANKTLANYYRKNNDLESAKYYDKIVANLNTNIIKDITDYEINTLKPNIKFRDEKSHSSLLKKLAIITGVASVVLLSSAAGAYYGGYIDLSKSNADSIYQNSLNGLSEISDGIKNMYYDVFVRIPGDVLVRTGWADTLANKYTEWYNWLYGVDESIKLLPKPKTIKSSPNSEKRTAGRNRAFREQNAVGKYLTPNKNIPESDFSKPNSFNIHKFSDKLNSNNEIKYLPTSPYNKNIENDNTSRWRNYLTPNESDINASKNIPESDFLNIVYPKDTSNLPKDTSNLPNDFYSDVVNNINNKLDVIDNKIYSNEISYNNAVDLLNNKNPANALAKYDLSVNEIKNLSNDQINNLVFEKNPNANVSTIKSDKIKINEIKNIINNNPLKLNDLLKTKNELQLQQNEIYNLINNLPKEPNFINNNLDTYRENITNNVVDEDPFAAFNTNIITN